MFLEYYFLIYLGIYLGIYFIIDHVSFISNYSFN